MGKSTYQRVKQWNERCNKLAPSVGTVGYFVALNQQLDLIQEELNETREAVAAGDLGNLCQEGADLDVVVSGLNFMIGSQYGKIIDSILTNNDRKYTSALAEADTWRKYWTDKGEKVAVVTAVEDGLRYHCVKRLSDSKVMKRPANVKPGITQYFPKGIQIPQEGE